MEKVCVQSTAIYGGSTSSVRCCMWLLVSRSPGVTASIKTHPPEHPLTGGGAGICALGAKRGNSFSREVLAGGSVGALRRSVLESDIASSAIVYGTACLYVVKYQGCYFCTTYIDSSPPALRCWQASGHIHRDEFYPKRISIDPRMPVSWVIQALSASPFLSKRVPSRRCPNGVPVITEYSRYRIYQVHLDQGLRS